MSIENMGNIKKPPTNIEGDIIRETQEKLKAGQAEVDAFFSDAFGKLPDSVQPEQSPKNTGNLSDEGILLPTNIEGGIIKKTQEKLKAGQVEVDAFFSDAFEELSDMAQPSELPSESARSMAPLEDSFLSQTLSPNISISPEKLPDWVKGLDENLGKINDATEIKKVLEIIPFSAQAKYRASSDQLLSIYTWFKMYIIDKTKSQIDNAVKDIKAGIEVTEVGQAEKNALNKLVEAIVTKTFELLEENAKSNNVLDDETMEEEKELLNQKDYLLAFIKEAKEKINSSNIADKKKQEARTAIGEVGNRIKNKLKRNSDSLTLEEAKNFAEEIYAIAKKAGVDIVFVPLETRPFSAPVALDEALPEQAEILDSQPADGEVEGEELSVISDEELAPAPNPLIIDAPKTADADVEDELNEVEKQLAKAIEDAKEKIYTLQDGVEKTEKLRRLQEIVEGNQSVEAKIGLITLLLVDKWDIPDRIKIKRESKEIDENIVAKFLEEFGLSADNLKSIEGFDVLSRGQQLLIFENLRQIAVGRIEEGGIMKGKEQYAKYAGKKVEYEKTDTRAQRAWKWLKNDAANTPEHIKTVGKNIWVALVKEKYIKAKAEKELVESMEKGGLDVHGEILNQLVRGLVEFGPGVDEKDGKIDIQYFNPEELGGLEEEDRKIINDLNSAAQEFSRIPFEWADVRGASRKENVRYNEAKENYENKLNSLCNLLSKKRISSEKIFSIVCRINGLVNQQQFLNSNPEAEKYLADIKSRAVWRRSLLQGVVGERLIYFGAGYATRTAAIAAMGVGGLPLAAATSAAFFARHRAHKQIKETYKYAKRGQEDKQFTREEQFIDAENFIESVNYLCDELEGIDIASSSKTEEMFRSLSWSLDDMKNNIEKGTVNFGEVNGRIMRQYKLYKTIARAEIILLQKKTETKINKPKILNLAEDYKEIYKLLNKLEEDTSRKETAFVAKKVLFGMTMGATFASAGMILREYLHPTHSAIAESSHAPQPAPAPVVETPPAPAPVVETPPAPAPLTPENANFQKFLQASERFTGKGGGSEKLAEAIKHNYETTGDAQASLGTVYKGEGIEHALRRQLEADPATYGFEGDTADVRAVHEWSGGRAHQLAIDNGYVDTDTGMEYRVGESGKVAYVLDKEGNITEKSLGDSSYEAEEYSEYPHSATSDTPAESRISSSHGVHEKPPVVSPRDTQEIASSSPPPASVEPGETGGEISHAEPSDFRKSSLGHRGIGGTVDDLPNTGQRLPEVKIFEGVPAYDQENHFVARYGFNFTQAEKMGINVYDGIDDSEWNRINFITSNFQPYQLRHILSEIFDSEQIKSSFAMLMEGHINRNTLVDFPRETGLFTKINPSEKLGFLYDDAIKHMHVHQFNDENTLVYGRLLAGDHPKASAREFLGLPEKTWCEVNYNAETGRIVITFGDAREHVYLNPEKQTIEFPEHKLSGALNDGTLASVRGLASPHTLPNQLDAPVEPKSVSPDQAPSPPAQPASPVSEQVPSALKPEPPSGGTLYEFRPTGNPSNDIDAYIESRPGLISQLVRGQISEEQFLKDMTAIYFSANPTQTELPNGLRSAIDLAFERQDIRVKSFSYNRILEAVRKNDFSGFQDLSKMPPPPGLNTQPPTIVSGPKAIR